MNAVVRLVEICSDRRIDVFDIFFMIIAQKTEFRACIGELISFFAFVTKIKYIFEPTLTCDSSNMYLLLAILVAIIKEVCFFNFLS